MAWVWNRQNMYVSETWMAAILVTAGSGTGNGLAWHGNTTTQTCASLPTGEQANCSGGDEGLWTGQHELRGLTTTGPAVRFKWTTVGFPKITSLASFWNSEFWRFRAWIFMDQSQPRKIQVWICSKQGDFQRKILASNSLKWPLSRLSFCMLNQ